MSKLEEEKSIFIGTAPELWCFNGTFDEHDQEMLKDIIQERDKYRTTLIEALLQIQAGEYQMAGTIIKAILGGEIINIA